MAASCMTAITPLFDNDKKAKSQCILYAIYTATLIYARFSGLKSHTCKAADAWKEAPKGQEAFLL